MQDVDAGAKEYHTRMEAIFSYMRERHFPPDLARKVKRCFRQRFREVM